MKNRLDLPSVYSVFRSIVCLLSVFAVTLALVLTGLVRTDKSVRTSGLRAAEETVRRCALCCYALEGSYPESYKYLKAHYDPKINDTFYAIHYTATASNIMPEITVTKRQESTQ